MLFNTLKTLMSKIAPIVMPYVRKLVADVARVIIRYMEVGPVIDATIIRDPRTGRVV